MEEMVTAKFGKNYTSLFYYSDNNHGVLSQNEQLPPENAYTVSCIPWISFKAFSVRSYENKPYYFPSVEAGKFYKKLDRMILPLSITCHHATTDGYHIECFLDTSQRVYQQD